ncbi:hypothetical protein PG994_009153 [Apiospora phragmitis]|uniref:DUF6590 domain-containing protein n=1 Tax=Apiospora phragmitis TaxID=2905665 RepID=A0ABR1UIH7_9PEZI
MVIVARGKMFLTTEEQPAMVLAHTMANVSMPWADRKMKKVMAKNTTGEENDEDDEGAYHDAAMARAVEDSRHSAYYGHDQAAGPSRGAPAYASGELYSLVDPELGTDNSQLQPEEEDDSTGLDMRSFNVVPSYYYLPGRVFKMLWSEPRGKHGMPTEKTWSHVDNFYFGVRRFIIIATDAAHHSTCVQGRQPELVNGEKGLGFAPVSCTMNPHEKLVKQSRVNYSKLVTIEHNVEVQFIGSITEGDFAIVTQAVDDCWNKKNRHSTRDSKSKSKPSKHSKSKSSKPSKTESETKHRSSSSKTSSDKKHSKRTH